MAHATLILRTVDAWLAAGILSGLGVACDRHGTALQFSASALNVADECSGLRNMGVLCTLTVVIVWTSSHSLRPLAYMLPAAVLLGFLGNLLRICVVAGAYVAWPKDASLCRSIHEWSGLPLFAFETLLLCRLTDRAVRRLVGVRTSQVDPAPSGAGTPAL